MHTATPVYFTPQPGLATYTYLTVKWIYSNEQGYEWGQDKYELEMGQYVFFYCYI